MGQTEVELGHPVLRCCQDGLEQCVHGEIVPSLFEIALPSGQAVISLSRGVTIALILPAVQIACIVDDRPSHDAEPASMAQARMKAAVMSQMRNMMSAMMKSAVVPSQRVVTKSTMVTESAVATKSAAMSESSAVPESTSVTESASVTTVLGISR